jgi:predicted TPR repeat methyltransferase
MPGSVAEGKDLVRDFCIKNDVHTVLDIGPGEGTYYHALVGADITKLDGVEVFVPYIDIYNLRSMYNELFIGDIYYFNWAKLDTYDMVILGDVIEHMVKEQGAEVIAQAVKKAKWVVVSLPIYGYEQGSACGNSFEAHLEQYSNESILEVLKDYNVVEQFQGSVVGVYIFSGQN